MHGDFLRVTSVILAAYVLFNHVSSTKTQVSLIFSSSIERVFEIFPTLLYIFLHGTVGAGNLFIKRSVPNFICCILRKFLPILFVSLNIF